MVDPASLATAIDNASKVASTPLFTTVIDKLTGFKISKWAAEGEIRKKLIHDEYQKAKESGIIGMQYIEYLRHTTNLIDTAAKSAKYIDQDKAHEIEMDNDFFWNTIEHAKSISNEEMQELIAKIIAGEYNEPGRYSMSTLQTLKMLGKRELELFETICSLCIEASYIPEMIFSLPESVKPILDSLKIDFGSLQSLQNLGLVLPNAMTRSILNPERKEIAISYFDREIKFKSTHESDFTILLPGHYQLSDTGLQLAKHLNSNFVDGYYDWLKTNYSINNYKVLAI